MTTAVHVSTALPLRPQEILDTVEAVRSVARWNRNRIDQPNREIAMVTTDWVLLARGARTTDVEPPRHVGMCYYRQEGRYIWLSSSRYRSRAEVFSTLVHELCHALTGVSTTHERSFRRLYTVAMPTAGRMVLPFEGTMYPEFFGASVVRRYTERRRSGYYLAPGAASSYDVEYLDWETAEELGRRRQEEVRSHSKAARDCYTFHFGEDLPQGIVP